MNIDKIRNIGLDKLITQVYDFDSLTTDELLCKFAQKINIIIEHFNYLDKQCQDNNEATKLKLEYLLGQGLDEQVSKRLLKLINDGTIGKLINETLLKEIKDDITTIENEKANKSEVRKKSVLIEDYDLGQSVKQLLTSGNVAVVGERCINKINVNNNAITLNQTDFIKQGNINLCLFTIFESGYINTNNGNLMSPSSEYKSTGFIAVSALNKYSSNENLNIAFYNSSKTFVSGKNGGTWSSPLTIPDNVSYIRLTYSETNVNPIFNLGDKTYIEEEAIITDKSLEALLEKQIYNKMLTYDVTSLNLYNSATDSADNTAINETNGKQITLNGYKATGFIEVIEGLNICISEQNNIAFYDENKNFVSGKTGGWTNPITIPTGVKYLRHTFSLTATNKQICYGDSLQNYSSFGEKLYIIFKNDFLDSLKQQLKYESKLKNKTWNVLGDSITYGLGTTKTYHQIIAERTGIEVNNYGLSTSTIAVNGWTGVQSFVERYVSMNKTADYTTVFGGVNDFIHKTPLGTFDSRDNTTFYGALHELCQGLYKKFTRSKILFITPYINEGAKTPRELDGKTLIDFVNAIEEVCGYYGIKVKNLYKESGIDANITIHKSSFAPDGLHLNELGHERISNSILSELENL